MSAVRNIGIAGIVGVLNTDTLIVADGHTGFYHDVCGVITLVQETIAANLIGNQPKTGIAGACAGACLHSAFAGIPAASSEGDFNTVTRLFGDIVDHTTDGTGAITQGRSAFEHFNAFHTLNTWVVVTTVANKQAGSHRNAILKDQCFVVA